MSKNQSFVAWGILALVLGAALTLSTAAVQDEPAGVVPQLISADTVLYLSYDGSERHKSAWEQTAAHEAMYQSGMVNVLEKLLESVGQQMGGQRNPEMEAALRHLDAQGATVAVSLPTKQGPPLPHVTVVFHEAAGYEELLSGLAKGFGGFAGLRFDEVEVGERKVTKAVVPNSPGIEVGIWAEQQHLFVTAGIGAVEACMAVADQQTPGLTANPLYTKYQRTAEGFEALSVAWLDLKALRGTYGPMPLPTPTRLTINDILSTVGLNNLDAVASQHGYKGRSLWSETTIEVDGPRSGLLAMSDQAAMTLADLPPLPANTSGFNATRLNLSAMWDTLTGLARQAATFGPPEGGAELEEMLDRLPRMIGLDLKSDLLDCLGDVICVYADPDQGFFGSGSGLMISVRDANRLATSMNRLLEKAETAADGDFQVHRARKHGREQILFEFAGLQIGAVSIDDKWLVAGLMPQTVEAALLRLDGQLDAWEPGPSQAEALAELPPSFTSITMGDPRVGWHALIKLAPLLLAGGQTALKEERILPPDFELPVTVADIPPAEVVIKPLFPNFTVTTSDAAGIHVTSRRSVPGVPLIGGFGGGNEIATAGIVTALILPAIQAARQAARRTQSANNLKQIALALYNYHDAYKHFPSGTVASETLNPDDRLSWMSSILPFIDQSALSDIINKDAAWNDESNSTAASIRVKMYLNPGIAVSAEGPAPAHYVGIAGLGEDAPTLPVTSNRAGVFGFNRVTRVRDITDGTSNTMMTSEATGVFGPWIAGGRGTIRPLTTKPYINGPDGIGGPYSGGCNIGMADGSVRFVSENVDPTVMERLSTIRDGQPIPNF